MKIVKVLSTELAAPFNAGDTTLTVRQFVDSKGVAVEMASIVGWGVVVITQGDTIEMVKFDDITQNDDGSATLSVATSGRDIDPTSPYAGYAEGQDFSTGAEVKMSNDPLTMSRFANLDEQAIFTEVPQSTADPVENDDLARKSYVDALLAGNLSTIDVVVPAKAGATVAAGDLVYFDTGVDRWKLCDADTAATVNDVLLGIAQGAGTNGNAIAGGVILQGIDTHQSGFAEGDPIYAGNTPGDLSNVPGTTNVQVGIAKSATEVYFVPRFNIALTKSEKDAIAGGGDFGTPSSTNQFLTEESMSSPDIIPKPVRHVYTANATWTKPAGLHHIEVEVQGGGAGGGSVTNPNQAAGGGDAGGYGKKIISADDLGATEAVVVGAAAAGGVAGGLPANGNPSNFGAHISASGGTGGGSRSASSAGWCGDGGNNPGVATGADVAIPGGFGYPAYTYGTAGQMISGRGGDSMLGKGGAPISTQGTGSGTVGNDGRAGTGYGSGGSGAASAASSADFAGGQGAQGVVIVTEYYI